jgi:hypothetical protein
MDKMNTADRRWRWSVSLAGACLLLGMAWIHEHLYGVGYSSVPTIGPLFRLNAVLGLLMAVVVVVAAVVPVIWWRLACAAGALLQLGTLGALVQSLTIGAFGFHETLDAPMIGRTVVVEALGFLVLAVGAAMPSIRRRTSEGERVADAGRGPSHR